MIYCEKIILNDEKIWEKKNYWLGLSKTDLTLMKLSILRWWLIIITNKSSLRYILILKKKTKATFSVGKVNVRTVAFRVSTILFIWGKCALGVLMKN